MVDRGTIGMKRRALACDGCRRAKRKCNGEQPCVQCRKRTINCSFSVDNRTARGSILDRSIFQRQKATLSSDPADQVVSFFVSDRLEEDKQQHRRKNSHSSISKTTNNSGRARTANEFLEELFGGAREIGRTFLDNSTNTKPNHLKIQPTPGMKTCWISKQCCDEYIQNHINLHCVSSDCVLGVQFYAIYRGIWDSKPPVGSSKWLYVYSVIGVGSLQHPVSSLEDAGRETQALYLAASTLVGMSVIEGTFETCMALTSFGLFSMMIGEFMATPRFCNIALNILINLGYDREEVYAQLDDRLREERLRYFWHMYTVCSLHSSVLNMKYSKPIDMKEIRAPFPIKDPAIGRDDNYSYLMNKLDIISIVEHTISDVSQLDNDDEKQVLEFLGDLTVTLDKFVQKCYTDMIIPETPSSHTYYLALYSLSINCMAATYRRLKPRSLRTWEPFEKALVEYIDVLYNYTVVEKRSYACVGWYLCHFAFMGSVMLIYCNRMREAELQPKSVITDNAINQSYEILQHMSPILQILKNWVEILDKLRSTSALAATLVAPESSSSFSKEIGEDFDIDGFLQQMQIHELFGDNWIDI